MTLVQVTPRARADLRVIARWTLRNWGEARMKTYLPDLSVRFDWLARNPLKGRLRPEIGDGHRSFPEGRHLVFCRIIPDGVAVIGVPHQSMDVTEHFSPAP